MTYNCHDKQKYLGLGIITSILIVTIVYSGFKVKDIFSGPDIEIISPQVGEIAKQSFVSITGQAKRITKLYLNDRKIFTDDAGNFRESLLLASGYNVWEVRAEDNYGRKIIKKIELVNKSTTN